MQRNSTIGELMERKRIQDGAKEYQGHTYMDLARFDDATKHMIIFDVLTDESPVGWKGERNRLYLSDVGYQKALDNQKAGNIKIISHGSKCILQLRGVRPFLSDKYDLTQHPNYKYTSDFDKRNEFNIEQFLSRRLKLKAGDEFVVVDAD